METVPILPLRKGYIKGKLRFPLNKVGRKPRLLLSSCGSEGQKDFSYLTFWPRRPTFLVVRGAGFEPAIRKELAPQASAYASSATHAHKVIIEFLLTSFLSR